MTAIFQLSKEWEQVTMVPALSHGPEQYLHTGVA
jgi:hypothetical protein